MLHGQRNEKPFGWMLIPALRMCLPTLPFSPVSSSRQTHCLFTTTNNPFTDCLPSRRAHHAKTQYASQLEARTSRPRNLLQLLTYSLSKNPLADPARRSPPVTHARTPRKASGQAPTCGGKGWRRLTTHESQATDPEQSPPLHVLCDRYVPPRLFVCGITGLRGRNVSCRR